MTTKTRATIFRIDSAERMPTGALRVKGRITKTGIFDYKLNGETLREQRSDSEVFDPDSLDTLRGAPVTIEHPSRFVGTDNWSLVSVGSVIGVEVNAPYVDAELLVHDEKAIGQIENGGLKEISCGYMMHPEFPQQDSDFDFSQTKIRYNHVALGPENWGRLGNDVGLRLDSKHNLDFEVFNMEKRTDEAAGAAAEGTEEPKADPVVPTEDSEPAAADEGQESESTDAPTAVTLDSLKAILDEHSTILAKLDSKDTVPAAETTDSKDDLDKIVSERVARELAVRGAHAKLCPGATQDGRSGRELCLEALSRIDSDISEDASDEILEAAVHAAAKVTDANDAPRLRDRLLGTPQPGPALGFKDRTLAKESK